MAAYSFLDFAHEVLILLRRVDWDNRRNLE